MNNGGFLGINKQNDLTIGLNNPERDFLYHTEDYVPNTHVWSMSSAGTAYLYTPFTINGFDRTCMIWLHHVDNGTNGRTFMLHDANSDLTCFYLTWNDFYVIANETIGVATYTVLNDAWHCYTVTQSGVSDSVAYSDGVLLTSAGTTGAQSAGGVLAGMISVGSRTGLTPFNGYIGAFAIWDKVLTSGEIYDVYNNGKPTRNLNRNFGNYQSSSNLRGWWLPCDAVWNGTEFEMPSRALGGGSLCISHNMTSGQLITTNLP